MAKAAGNSDSLDLRQARLPSTLLNAPCAPPICARRGLLISARANLKGLWFPYRLFFVTYAHAMARLEAWLLGNPLYFSMFCAFAMPALFAAVVYRNRLWNSDQAFVHVESAQPAVRTLNLNG